MPYEQIQSGLRSEEDKREALKKALLNQMQGFGDTQMVSGRAVPNSPITGITKIIEALINKGAIGESEAATKELLGQQGMEKQAAISDVMSAFQGTPAFTSQESAGMLPGQMGDPAAYAGTPVEQAAVEGDPMKAALLASSSPYTEDMSSILSASAKGGASPYFTPEDVVTKEGDKWVVNRRVLNRRTGEYVDGGKEYLSKDDPRVKGLASQYKSAGKVTGEAMGQAQVDLPSTEIKADETIQLVDELLEHPGMKDVVGFPDNPLVAKGLVPGTEAADFRGRLNQLTGRTFMEVFPTLKGGGQITEIEGQKAQESINRMSASTSEEEFKKSANDFKQEVNRLKELVRKRATGEESVPTVETDIESLLQKY
jgi:hypothetical protein